MRLNGAQKKRHGKVDVNILSVPRRGVREGGGAPVAKCDYIYILNAAVCLFWTDAKHKSCLVT